MLQRLFIFLLLVLILPDIYLYLRFYRSAHSKAVVANPLLATECPFNCGVAIPGVFRQQSVFRKPYTGYRMVLHLLFLFAAPKLLLALCTVVGIPFHKWLRMPRTPFICTGLTLAVLSIFMILYGSFIGRSRFEVKEVTYSSSRLPQAFDGYRIVQLSDLHIGSWIGNASAIERMVNLVNAQQPDLIVFTGDLVKPPCGGVRWFSRDSRTVESQRRCLFHIGKPRLWPLLSLEKQAGTG